jgi:hypothetical protein
MYDQGRVTDFLDDYSPYLDQKYTDLVDGLPMSIETGDCVHLFTCENCGLQDIRIQ